MEHRVHLYTGPGKGKTTAAMGIALRALGHDWTVVIAQFMKDQQSGELNALAKLPGAIVYEGTPMNSFTFLMPPEKLADVQQEQTLQAAQLAAFVKEKAPQMVILDELALAVSMNLVTEEAAISLIDTCRTFAETVVTGRDAPEWLCRAADYVSIICDHKHPYATEGLQARLGVEW